MSLIFTALEIGSGDAFLLEDSEKNWNCLFDAGGSKRTIVTLLKRKLKEGKTNKLNLAICSHNDIDHANGFIGLLESDIEIDEIWLPGTWTGVLKYVEDNGISDDDIECMVNVEQEYLGRNTGDGSIIRKNEDGSMLVIGNARVEFDPESSDPIEDFDESLVVFSKAIEPEFHTSLMRRWYLYDAYYWHRNKKQMGIGHPSLLLALDKIIQIGGLAYRKGCKIRWFDPLGPCEQKRMDYGFVALNSSEMMRVQKPRDPHSFALLCSLTVENVYSTVFEYCDNDTPIIRFSADSDCTAQSSTYDGAIVTAPHHGSEANAIVYSAIEGKNIIWVRSDRKSKKRPCQAFKNLQNKYCLACFKTNIKKEIRFTYDRLKMRWSLNHGCPCIC